MSEEAPIHATALPFPFPCQLRAWSVAVGSKVRKGTLLCSCVQSVGVGGEGGREGEAETELQIKSAVVGVVQELMFSPGDVMQPGSVVVKVEEKCQHDIVVFDMCADCGLNLRKQPSSSGSASQPVAANFMVIHDNAGIRISQQEAEVLAHKDKLRLLKTRKLTLVVDLDQTLIHTSTDPHIEPGLPDVHGFRLSGQPAVYHCRLRPHIRQFLQKVSKLYELHVFTMATKDYASAVIDILDPGRHLFCDRIITRDEFFDPRSKALRFKSVFPCGDSMVAIIDDREDVWGRCPNLVHVKPYVFFSGTSDINAPPPLIPTSATSSASLPSTPTTPRPFFSGSLLGSGVVPQGQPKPFKMRHVTRQPRSGQQTAQPASDLARHSRSAQWKDSRSSVEQQRLQSPVEHRQNEQETADNANGVKNSENSDGRAVDQSNDSRPSNSTAAQLHQDSLVGTAASVNSNNNNSNTQGGADSTGSGDSASEGEGEGEEGEGGGGEGGGEGAGGGEEEKCDGSGGGERTEGRGSGGRGGVREEGGSSSSSSSSSSDSEDSSSSGSSSAMDDTPYQEAEQGAEKGEVGAVEGRSNDIVQVAVDDGERKEQDSQAKATPVEAPTSVTAEKSERPAIVIKDPDSFLTYLADVLERIHSLFYTQFAEMTGGCDISTMSDIPTPDLKLIIPQMRQSVLKGAKILFTGVIPTNIPPQRSPVWNTARAFGAVIHDRVVPGLESANPRTAMKATTHVIAGKSGTAKLKEAKKMAGVKIVNPRWLWSCAEQWKWLEEKQFPVEPDEAPGSKETKREAGGRDKHDGHQGDAKIEPDNNTSSTDSRLKFSKPNSKLHEKEKQPRCDKSGRNRLDSRISVSDEELEKMEAEVEAEMDSSSSSSSSSDDEDSQVQAERLGSTISVEKSGEDTLNYDQFAGGSAGSGDDGGLVNRKRKHVEVDNSSRSSSPQSNSDPHTHSNSSESSDDLEDELAALLEEDSVPL